MLAGFGFLIYFAYYLFVWFYGFTGLTVSIVLSRIILQQLSTGFYEEILYRGLTSEGYFSSEKKTIAMRFLYAGISSAIFGAIHIITDFNIYRFLTTGAIGFAFATIYLISHNITVPMLLHFIYDIFANLTGYIKWSNSEAWLFMNGWLFNISMIVMFAVSCIILRKMLQATENNPLNTNNIIKSLRKFPGFTSLLYSFCNYIRLYLLHG